MGLQAVEVFFVIQLAREGRLDFFLYHGFKYISLCKRLEYDYKRVVGRDQGRFT